jgi:hypothetical protein
MMSRSRLRAAGFVLVALLAFPRPGNAGLIDFIWGMSGPQVIGVIALNCKVYFDGAGSRCKVIDDVWRGKRAILAVVPEPFLDGRLRFEFETILFSSTGVNADNGDEYGPGQINMLALDPMVEIGSRRYKRLLFYHGVGAAINRVFVKDDLSDFWKAGVKIRPVAFTIDMNPELDFAINLRFYPKGFGRDQFGFGSAPAGDRPSEWVYGGSFGFAW